ncbi:MAG TPA: hypothetical protein VFQ48_10845, partial [Pseudonocardiaceae bacterium]|nr:hypothetical protein [Pseudonocardiaceae bacterium]
VFAGLPRERVQVHPGAQANSTLAVDVFLVAVADLADRAVIAAADVTICVGSPRTPPGSQSPPLAELKDR